jgi:lipopolysaccharide transport protein LptA
MMPVHLLAALLALFLLLPDRAGAEDPVEEAAERFGLSLSSDAATSIRSRELEASRDDSGRERVIFLGEVQVDQGNLKIHCDWLEATYPKTGEGGPERLVARGNVRILQGGREARCTEAVFHGPENRAVCRSTSGSAVLRRGDDTVEGEEIHFDLASSTVKVKGGAFVRVGPREGGQP